jgi:hypothetical protein
LTKPHSTITLVETDAPNDIIRVRSTFSKTLKGGWSDESTIELTINTNGPNKNWATLFQATLNTLAAITQAECDRRNQHDINQGGNS